MRLCVLSCFALLTSVQPVWSQADMPENTYVCQVLSGAGETHVVEVQADSVERARLVVTGAAGPLYAEKVPPGRTLVQCVSTKSAGLSDRAAQQAYEALLR